MRRISLMLLSVAMCVPISAIAKNPKGFKPAPLGLFGIDVNASWNVKECGWVQTTCFTRASPSGSAITYTVELRGSPQPDFLKFGNFNIVVEDNKIQQIMIFTKGIASQDEVLAELIVKFGEARKFEKNSVQNGFGASFISADCTWTLAGGALEFQGIMGDANTGVITATSSSYQEKLDKQPQDQRL